MLHLCCALIQDQFRLKIPKSILVLVESILKDTLNFFIVVFGIFLKIKAIPGSIVPLVATANIEAAMMNMLPISSKRMPNHLLTVIKWNVKGKTAVFLYTLFILDTKRTTSVMAIKRKNNIFFRLCYKVWGQDIFR